jgi:hypothetical protein
MIVKRTFVQVLAATAVVLACSAAHAEPSADDRAVARTLFEDGRALLKQGNYAQACPKLEESQRLDPGIGTLFNLADCYEHVGRIASAWAAFSEVADVAKRAGQTDRETIARERANALAPKVSKLRLRMAAPPSGLELRYDDKPLSTAVLGTDMPVDPGEHHLRASAPGKAPADTRVKIEVGSGITTVDLPALADAEAPAPGPGPAPAPEQPLVEPPRPESGSSWQKPAAIGAGALAVVGLGVGTFFGLRASSQWSDAKASCPDNRCDDAGYSKWDDARSSAGVATIAFSAGAVLAAAAIVLFVTAPSNSSAPPPATARARERSLWRMP